MPSSASAAFRPRQVRQVPAVPALQRRPGAAAIHQRHGRDAYDEVGAKRVAVNQNGPQLAKRQGAAGASVNGTLG